MRQDIYETIRDRIVFLEYPPGRILNEKGLAAEFGVSRTPLREVLSRLEWEKLVRVIPRTGTMVAEIEVHRIREVFQVRLDIEGLTGRLAAENIADEHFERLNQIRARCAALAPDYDPKALVNIDVTFRGVLLEAANNSVLKEISESLYNLTARIWYMVVDRANWEHEVRLLAGEIEQTTQVLRRRDPDEAYRVKQMYLNRFIQRVRDRI